MPCQARANARHHEAGCRTFNPVVEMIGVMRVMPACIKTAVQVVSLSIGNVISFCYLAFQAGYTAPGLRIIGIQHELWLRDKTEDLSTVHAQPSTHHSCGVRPMSKGGSRTESNTLRTSQRTHERHTRVPRHPRHQSNRRVPQVCQAHPVGFVG